MTSLFGYWWKTHNEKMDGLHNANELLLTEREHISKELLVLKQQARTSDEERTRFQDEQQKLRAQNQGQADKILRIQKEASQAMNVLKQNKNLSDKILKIESEALQHKNLVKQIKAKDDNVSKLHGEALRYRKQISAKDDKIRELLGEIAQYKKSISSSTMRPGQMSDASIQSAMDGLFYAVQDWALEVLRQEKTVLNTVIDERAEWLYNQVPGYKDGSSTQKVHALIAIFSDAVCLSTRQDWVFGVDSQDPECPLGAANFVHAAIKEIPDVAPGKKKQWALLTKELLSRDGKAVKRSLEVYVSVLTSHVAWCLGSTTAAANVVAKLGSAIGPHVHVLQALKQQEADYNLHLLPACKGDIVYASQSKYMEDVTGEDDGMLKAIFFPMLIKTIETEGNGKTGSAVVCKSRVTVMT